MDCLTQVTGWDRFALRHIYGLPACQDCHQGLILTNNIFSLLLLLICCYLLLFLIHTVTWTFPVSNRSSIDCPAAFASKKAFQCWRATPLPGLRNWDWERKSAGFSEFRGWKFCSEKTQSSSRHARVLLWSMNLSFSLTAFPLPDPPCCLELHFWQNIFQTSAACHPSYH